MDGTATLTPGLDNPVFDSVRIFRLIADAMARPGEIKHIPVSPPAPAPLMPAAAALCLTLLDFETPLWMQHPQRAVIDYLRFHCGCPITPQPQHASFALITDTFAMPDISAFNAGDPEYPDRAATLVIQVAGMSNATGVRLSGPGLRQPGLLDVAGLSAACWRELQDNRAAFPCGVDVVFVWGGRIAALPRSCNVVC